MISTNTRIWIFAFLFLLGHCARAQQQFDPDQLRQPAKYGPVIASALNTVEVYEFNKDTAGTFVCLSNGFRSSQLSNTEAWLALKDSVEPYRIDIVYSKYPLRKGTYNEIYPLLLNRLINLFGIDGALNDSQLTWNKVLQTHCVNDDQVDSLFHGVVIWYHAEADMLQADAVNATDSMIFTVSATGTINTKQGLKPDLKSAVDNIKSTDVISDSLKALIAGLPVEKQSELIKKYLEKEIATARDIDLSTASKKDMEAYSTMINKFLARYPSSDLTVSTVLTRHKNWRHVLVVNDWTGSMYCYGAQVLQWHLLNLDTSGISSLTLFNDGDLKPTSAKRIGNTGGIYSEDADNIPALIKLFNLIMLKGSGGDGPENDVEAILTAISKFPDHQQLVLIADNNSCVRDIELADRIHEPVKVILCGYSESRGVNPDYVYLAKITGGGIYTIEQDIEDIETGLGSAGELTDFNDKRFKIIGHKCLDLGDISAYIDFTFTDYKSARHKHRKVRRLELVDKGLLSIPRGVYKMKSLNYLNLSKNQLKAVSSKISKLKYLKTVDLSYNKLQRLPETFEDVLWVEELNLSYNEIKVLNKNIIDRWSLRSLDVSHNHIKKVSEELSLPNLGFLDLSSNEIKELPKAIGRMRKLEILNISDNQLEALPATFVKMRKLQELNASGNHLKALPGNLNRLKNLKTLNLTGNDLPAEERARIKAELPNVTIFF